ncbi:SgcJ/EcaC family oxidoreductase [Kitasatospora sp. NPDC006697]|uniref:SgcJ/EcaC family oxidoreductase n=1 Tax=Kitasatospora sp. NPDC006697 TaxID=3364020 RepID=UPI0036B8C300
MSDSRAADVTAIQAVLADSYRAWDGGDATAMVADYTEDATVLMPGTYHPDREAIRAGMAAAFAGPLKGTSTSNERISLRFLGADAAIALIESGILFPGETEVPAERRVNASWVFEKRDGRWLVAAYQNCPVLTPGQ